MMLKHSLIEVVGDISDASSISNFSDTFFAPMKNLMSLTIVIHKKKLINSLIDYRNTI